MANLRTRATLRSREHRALVSVIVASRKETGLTQEALAAEVARHIERKTPDKTWIARIESGDRVIGAVEPMWLSRAMGKKPEALMELAGKWLEVK